MLKRIHVNRHNISANRKDGQRRPVFTVKTSKGNRKGNAVEIRGESVLRYSPGKPLPCGAVAWIETHAEVIVDDISIDNQLNPRTRIRLHRE